MILYNLVNVTLFKEEASKSMMNVDEPILLIMYTDLERNTYYVTNDLHSKENKNLLKHKTNNFPDGYLSDNRKTLYFTYSTYNTEWEPHLVKKNFENKNNDCVYLYIPDLYPVQIQINKNKIFMKVIQLDDPYRRNFNIAVYDLETNEINIWNKEEKDLSVWRFEYNPYTQKLYGVERSESEIREAQPPKLPTYKVVEFDKEGNRLRKLLEIKMHIDSISVSKDGKYGIFTGSTHSYNDIFVVNFEDGTIKTIIKGNSTNLVKWPIFSPEEKGFYFLAITSESVKLTDDTGDYWTRGVYYYDFQTKEITKIFMKDDGIVVNYKLIN